MEGLLIERCREILDQVPIETQVEALQECAEGCFFEQDAQIFKNAIAVLTGEAVYEGGEVKYLDPQYSGWNADPRR